MPGLDRSIWKLECQPKFIHAFGGALDVANGFDQKASFESHLKFQALFFEKIVVPDGSFYMPGPILQNVRRLRSAGGREDENVLLALLKDGVLIPSLRHGESLLENWKNGGRGIRPGELGYPPLNEGKKLLEVIERHVKVHAHWPELMAESSKPAYSKEIQRLFVGLYGDGPTMDRNLISALLRLKKFPEKGWHSLLRRFQDSIESQIAGGNFRRAGLEEAVVQHFALERISDVYEFLNSIATERSHQRWPEVAVARTLLRISTTVHEAYQARQFNCVGTLFPDHFRGVVNADLYSRVVELNAGRPHYGGPIMPMLCIDPRKIPIERVRNFRRSPIFHQYCELLRELKSEGPERSFIDTNAPFYEFVKQSYLPAIVHEFDTAIDGKLLKKLGGLLQTSSITLAAGASVATLITQTSVLGAPLFAAIALAAGRAAEKGADGVSDLMTRVRDVRLIRRAMKHMNGFIASEKDAALSAEAKI